MKVVVDTSIIVDYLRGGPAWNTFIETITSDTELYLPTIVIFELFGGKSTRDSSEEKRVQNFINQFQRVDLNREIAKKAGELYRDFGKAIDAPDYIIAATALELRAEVLTLNEKHFSQIPHIKIFTY